MRYFVKIYWLRICAAAIAAIEYVSLHSDQIVGVIETLAKIGGGS